MMNPYAINLRPPKTPAIVSVLKAPIFCTAQVLMGVNGMQEPIDMLEPIPEFEKDIFN